jgi:dTDP-4-dehydrorhamnose 3,5-epimerase
MRIIKTKFDKLILVKKKTFYDKRGYLFENFNKKSNFLIPELEILSCSKKNVIRGLHFQKKNQQSKYLTVISGKIIDICLDLRKNSKTFGKIFKTELSDNSKKNIFIPKGFAHGFLTLKKNTIVYYLASNHRYEDDEHTILWNDPDLKINWPKKKYIISKKDENGILFSDFKKKYKGL